MQITLKQTELESALKHYISTQGFNLTGKSISIDFTAGRGTSGHSATIDIEDAPGLVIANLNVVNTARDASVDKVVAQAAGAAAEAKTDAPFDTDDRPLGGLPAADAHEGTKTTSLFA